MNAAEAIFMAVQIWGWIGAAVALVFLTIGIDRIDEDARGAYIFRPLLIPGVLVIWPLVLWRWYRYETGADKWPARYDPPRKSHFTVGLILPVAIVAIIAVGLVIRQSWPAEFEPVQISAPGEVSQ
ncbi:hypothetical protein C8N43_1767 [Litoreibacter ponti]|uniref:Uncharacterized protein n=1 Tax=Litoreibacter ponti TaxID=1510457 RepID=A0A2T6BM18_9RHOB|nr:hypothetical protein [Litoreibacter ponti]PTX57101.1 hypothetical protein C8N43_1767 [Litoreibacter ponti]